VLYSLFLFIYYLYLSVTIYSNLLGVYKLQVLVIRIDIVRDYTWFLGVTARDINPSNIPSSKRIKALSSITKYDSIKNKSG
jgi:hypothetical protein